MAMDAGFADLYDELTDEVNGAVYRTLRTVYVSGLLRSMVIRLSRYCSEAASGCGYPAMVAGERRRKSY